MQRSFTDMIGRVVTLKAPPVRIVSLVPSQTELLFDLGLEGEVAGITKFCVHPESWFRSKPRIGGTKDVRYDRVAALHPDLIIANKEENVEAQVLELEKLCPVWVSDIQTLEDSLQMIREVGTICNRAERALEIAAQITTGFAELHQSAQGKRVAYGIWRDPWMWAGGDTFIHDILLRCGWTNALEVEPRYPAVSLEELTAYNPELVLLSSEPYPFKAKHIEEVKAVLPGAEVILVDGEMFSWYGSRLLHAPAYLERLLQTV